ncbi:Acetyltransferase (GNAT) family protein [compost metagenome]
MSAENIIITNKIKEEQKHEVAKLYFQAFLKKFIYLWVLTCNEEKATIVLRRSIQYEKGLYAINNNKLVGFVGLEKGDGYFAPLTFSSFSEAFGFIGATWRFTAYGIYRLFHGGMKKDVVHIDPIVVSSEARGLGIGTKLLDAVFEYSKRLNKNRVVLEVVDTNPKAKKLYERMGFQVVNEENISFLTQRAGFKYIINMEKVLPDKAL